MGDILQRAHIGLWTGWTAPDQQHRDPRQMGIGYAGNTVCDPRACGRKAYTQFAGQFSMGMGHVNRSPFVPDIDDLHAILCQKIPDRLDVTALQSKHTGHTPAHQRFCDPGGDTVSVGIQVFLYFWIRVFHDSSSHRVNCGLY